MLKYIIITHPWYLNQLRTSQFEKFSKCLSHETRMYLFQLPTFQCHLWLHLIINYYIREFMVLSLLASYANALHYFHKISNCISASKNSSIITFFQLCHKPPAFLLLYRLVAAEKNSWLKRERNECLCIPRNGKREWKVPLPVSRTVSLVRTVPRPLERGWSTEADYSALEELSSVKREQPWKHS